jgi:CPA1 family monovalent cation:H+ antiporter
VFIISWCGMRGIVSLAAALALPVALDNGQPFPFRDVIIFITFVVIAVTLVLQGLTLPPVIRWLKLATDMSGHDEQQLARTAMGKAAVVAIDRCMEERPAPPELAERLRAEFAEDVKLVVPGDVVLPPTSDHANRLRAAAIRAQRKALIREWRMNRISDDVLHQLEEELDYREARL